MEGQVELEKEKQLGPDVRRKTTQSKQTSKTLSLDCYEQARTALEKIKTEYAGKSLRKEDSEIDMQAQKIEETIDKRIRETEKIIKDTDKLVKDRTKLLESLHVESEEEESFDEGRWSHGREKGTLRPLAKQLPILIKGTQGQYVPWATQDLEGLVSRLPDIHEGAGKWIRVFEEETMGKLLAVGDIKALLARVIGGTKMEEILEASELDRAVNSFLMDGTVFDMYRPAVWQTLRHEYPTKIDPKALKGEELGDSESPFAYVQRQLKRWKQETEGNPEGDPLMATLFRNAIVDAMPQPVKSKLEDVVGLNSKTHKEFCDHVTHAVEQYRKNEQKLKNQEKDMQRKLTQLQLEQLTSSHKKKIQATVQKKEASEQMTVTTPVNVPPSTVQLPPPAVIPPNMQQFPTPTVNVYAQQPEPWRKNPQQGVQTGKGIPKFPQGVCWNCGLPGHSKRYCPIGQLQRSSGGVKGGGWRQPFRGPYNGPVNPWGGPNQGY